MKGEGCGEAENKSHISIGEFTREEDICLFVKAGY